MCSGLSLHTNCPDERGVHTSSIWLFQSSPETWELEGTVDNPLLSSSVDQAERKKKAHDVDMLGENCFCKKGIFTCSVKGI